MSICLDLGCGRGSYVRSILRQGHVYRGLDISHANIEYCRKRFPAIPGDSFIAYNGKTFPLADSEVDAVCANDVLEHVDDLEMIAAEIDRVLKPGGTLNIRVPHPLSEKWIKSFCKTYWEDVHHVRSIDRQQLQSRFKNYRLASHRREEGIQNLELFLIWLGGCRIDSQLGDWNARNPFSRIWRRLVLAGCILFAERIFRTKYRFIPVWPITYPIGRVISQIMPKTNQFTLVKQPAS